MALIMRPVVCREVLHNEPQDQEGRIILLYIVRGGHVSIFYANATVITPTFLNILVNM